MSEQQHDGPAERARLPHVVMDRDSRVFKARKIVALVGEARFRDARRVLEIGCGSGVISSTLARFGSPGLAVDAVDVVDSRVDTAGYTFQRVEGTTLPFADGVFDLVISNHVIEHVGAIDDQLRHLAEIRRVLAPGGMVYLAVPNKWRLVEPHFRLPLLSWFSPAVSDRYVRAAGRGTHYDCLPLALRPALDLFGRAGFTARNATVPALRETLAIEWPDHAIASASRRIPDGLLATLMPIMPTFVFLLQDARA